MPWRGPEVKGEFPTLGYLVADFIEASCAIPDGVYAGEPFLLTDEQLLFVLWHYRLHPRATGDVEKPSAPFTFRRSQLVRPQKWGKGPLAAAMICAEAQGPVLFDGWDAKGNPVGRPWPTPLIQVTAVSEDQTDNIWRALVPMIELGDIAADIPDTGETRINLAGATGVGRIEPVTASARSRLGQRITFAAQDQTESWLKRNGGVTLADNQRRNLAGMGGRSIETPNAWDPAEGSVAQTTYESEAPDVYIDYPTPPKGDFSNPKARDRILKHGYGDSWWVDLKRIDAECRELIPRDPAQAERWFGNRISVAVDAWLAVDAWKRKAKPLTRVKKGELVALGFDGSQFEDSTVLLGCRLRDLHIFTLGVWEHPDGAAGEGWEVPRGDVDGIITETFDRYKVVRMYADPPYWRDEIDDWRARYGDRVVLPWYTNRARAMAGALERLQTGIVSGKVTNDGERRITKHVGNARKDPTASGDLVKKPVRGGPEKIDGVIGAALALEAASDAIADGALKPKNKPGRLVSR